MNQNKNTKQIVRVSGSYSGAVPMASEMKEYKHLGYAERIIAMAEKEQENIFEEKRRIADQRDKQLSIASRTNIIGIVLLIVNLLLAFVLSMIIIYKELSPVYFTLPTLFVAVPIMSIISDMINRPSRKK